ncbi:MAG: hypothetical protein AAGJ81_10730 [Verrucomicrobiota bacterium]
MKLKNITLIASFILAFASTFADQPAFYTGELIDDKVRTVFKIDNNTPITTFYRTYEPLGEIPAEDEGVTISTRQAWTFFGVIFNVRSVRFALPDSEIEYLVQTAEEEGWTDREKIDVLSMYQPSRVPVARVALGVDYAVPAETLTWKEKWEKNRLLNGQITKY